MSCLRPRKTEGPRHETEGPGRSCGHPSGPAARRRPLLPAPQPRAECLTVPAGSSPAGPCRVCHDLLRVRGGAEAHRRPASWESHGCSSSWPPQILPSRSHHVPTVWRRSFRQGPDLAAPLDPCSVVPVQHCTARGPVGAGSERPISEAAAPASLASLSQTLMWPAPSPVSSPHISLSALHSGHSSAGDSQQSPHCPSGSRSTSRAKPSPLPGASLNTGFGSC